MIPAENLLDVASPRRAKSGLNPAPHRRSRGRAHHGRGKTRCRNAGVRPPFRSRRWRGYFCKLDVRWGFAMPEESRATMSPRRPEGKAKHQSRRKNESHCRKIFLNFPKKTLSPCRVSNGTLCRDAFIGSRSGDRRLYRSTSHALGRSYIHNPVQDTSQIYASRPKART